MFRGKTCTFLIALAAAVTTAALLSMSLTGCAYRLGGGSGRIAGGYRQVSIPMFKNRSQETGMEVAFTQALHQQFMRSNHMQVVDEPKAEVRVEGEITSITYFPDAKRTANDSSSGYLPDGTVIAAKYNIQAFAHMRVIRRSDGEVLWEGVFKGERPYSAPQVTLSGLNSVDPLYNLSARRQNIEIIADDMMVEAYSRMTENF